MDAVVSWMLAASILVIRTQRVAVVTSAIWLSGCKEMDAVVTWMFAFGL